MTKLIIIMIVVVAVCYPIHYYITTYKPMKYLEKGDMEKFKEHMEFLNSLEYKNGYNITCPTCGRLHVYPCNDFGKTFMCPKCKYRW